MAEGMPYFKAQKTPVETFEESLEDIESQASLLFDEFLRLPQTANNKLGSNRAKSDISDSPVIPDEKVFKPGAIESNEAEEDDVVPDCEVVMKGFHALPSPPVPQAVRQPQDPNITKLAQQMQQAGDALYDQYGARVDGVQSHLVKYVLDNAANLTYERLSREIDNMVGRDRSWTNFVMAMQVGKRVCVETSKACSAVTRHFQQYISHSYSQAMQQAGGVAPFVKSRGH